MELTPRQKKTIKHLQQHRGITEPMGIIKFCVEKLSKPAKSSIKNGKRLSRTQTRKHSKKHYQGIINYYAQGKANSISK